MGVIVVHGAPFPLGKPRALVRRSLVRASCRMWAHGKGLCVRKLTVRMTAGMLPVVSVVG